LVVLFLIWINHSNKVEPIAIDDANKLHDIIGRLYRKGKNGDVLFILDRISKFTIRIIKIERKTKEDTLKVEIRASDKNSEGYLTAKDALSDEGLEFEEILSPKLKRPSRIYLKNADGGIFLIPTLVKAISRVLIAINKSNEIDALASHKDPFFWKKLRT
jgi:hypothetical protein